MKYYIRDDEYWIEVVQYDEATNSITVIISYNKKAGCRKIQYEGCFVPYQGKGKELLLEERFNEIEDPLNYIEYFLL